jgi:hypothetical protein
MITTPEAISIAELCVYVPVFFLTILIVIRHGFARQSGWIYLAIFCLIRIIGAVFKIESATHPFSRTDAEWGIIFSSVGLSPLLLASFGLLKRVTDLVTKSLPSDIEAGNSSGGGRYNKRSGGGLLGKIVAKRVNATSNRSKLIQLIQIPVVVGLVLCIIGGTDGSSMTASEAKKGISLTKAGVVVFAVAYVVLAALLALTARDAGEAPRGEKRLYWVIVAAMPFLAVRLLYSLIALFGHDSKFKIGGGDPWINFGMAIVSTFLLSPSQIHVLTCWCRSKSS